MKKQKTGHFPTIENKKMKRFRHTKAILCQPQPTGKASAVKYLLFPNTPALNLKLFLLFLILSTSLFVYPQKDYTILFETGKADISEKQMKDIETYAHLLKQKKNSCIKLFGYTDSIGSLEYNKTLSEKRNYVIKTILLKEGIPDSSIITFSMGKTSPIASNSNVEGRAQNRCVRISISDCNKKEPNIEQNSSNIEFKLSGKKDTTLKTSCGCSFKIPKGAFVDKLNKPLNGQFSIYIINYKDEADFITSGIPMSYVQNGDLTLFNSYHMFEIKASQYGEAIFLKPGIQIKLQCKLPKDKNIKLYQFNSNKNSWDIFTSKSENINQTINIETEDKSPIEPQQIKKTETVIPQINTKKEQNSTKVESKETIKTESKQVDQTIQKTEIVNSDKVSDSKVKPESEIKKESVKTIEKTEIKAKSDKDIDTVTAKNKSKDTASIDTLSVYMKSLILYAENHSNDYFKELKLKNLDSTYIQPVACSKTEKDCSIINEIPKLVSCFSKNIDTIVNVHDSTLVMYYGFKKRYQDFLFSGTNCYDTSILKSDNKKFYDITITANRKFLHKNYDLTIQYSLDKNGELINLKNQWQIPYKNNKQFISNLTKKRWSDIRVNYNDTLKKFTLILKARHSFDSINIKYKSKNSFENDYLLYSKNLLQKEKDFDLNEIKKQDIQPSIKYTFECFWKKINVLLPLNEKKMSFQEWKTFFINNPLIMNQRYSAKLNIDSLSYLIGCFYIIRKHECSNFEFITLSLYNYDKEIILEDGIYSNLTFKDEKNNNIIARKIYQVFDGINSYVFYERNYYGIFMSPKIKCQLIIDATNGRKYYFKQDDALNQQLLLNTTQIVKVVDITDKLHNISDLRNVLKKN